VSPATGSSVSESCHARMAPRTQSGADMTGHVCARRPRERGGGSGLNASPGPKPRTALRCSVFKDRVAPTEVLPRSARTASRATTKYISLIDIPARRSRRPGKNPGTTTRLHGARAYRTRTRLNRRRPTWSTSPSSSDAGMSSCSPSTTRPPTRTPPCWIRRRPSLRLRPK